MKGSQVVVSDQYVEQELGRLSIVACACGKTFMDEVVWARHVCSDVARDRTLAGSGECSERASDARYREWTRKAIADE